MIRLTPPPALRGFNDLTLDLLISFVVRTDPGKYFRGSLSFTDKVGRGKVCSNYSFKTVVFNQ